MASSYTTNLRFTLPVQGELAASWGNTVNTGVTSLVDSAISGTASIALTGTTYTLTVASGATDESRQMFLTFTGTPGGAATVTCPGGSGVGSKLYYVTNNTNVAVTLKTALGTGISVPVGVRMALYCDGTNVINASTSTGTGNVVLATSPTLVTPILGTPTSGTLTNATGLPLTTGVTGTLPVANGGTGVTSSTGSGNVVLSTSPTLVTPILGTPTSGTLTNATGLPIGTGVSGLGTGVATALAVNVGTAGAPVVNGGVLGTPSSGTLTNATGLPLTTGITGTLPVANGGTGVTSSTGTGNNVLSSLPSFGTTIGVGGATASASGSGISFPATQSASTDANTLDDYEEGTWTPTLTISGLTTGITYTARSASYVKVGRIVYISLNIQLSSKGSLTGDVIITALPFTTNSVANGYAYFGAADYSAMSSVTAHVYAQALNNSTSMYLCNGSLASTAVDIAQDTNLLNTSAFTLTGTYITA